jgi:hypothetical protein
MNQGTQVYRLKKKTMVENLGIQSFQECVFNKVNFLLYILKILADVKLSNFLKIRHFPTVFDAGGL